jgi:uncharacterized protein (TIGR00255 family)
MMSMTGYGEYRVQDERWNVLVEVRSVNSRHLKLIAKISEPYAPLEAELERLVRDKIRRGTVYLTLRIEPNRPVDSYRLNQAALRAYREQIVELCREWSTPPPADWSQLLVLPGVVLDHVPEGVSIHEDWSELSKVVLTALDLLAESRRREGQAMAQELKGYAEEIRESLRKTRERLPDVVGPYHERLLERVQALTEKHNLHVNRDDLIREVAVFADRSDVSEEITRLSAHLDQFEEIVSGNASEGRKLEFLVQEMGREINTLGSKALDVSMSRHGLEMKTTLEKIRELIQNVE